MKYEIVSWGKTFDQVAEDVQAVAKEHSTIVEFEFNGVICYVNADTNLDLLYRDYCNSWLMEWKTVGPHCVGKYSTATQAEMDEKQRIKDIKDEKARQEYLAKEKKERLAFEKSVVGIEVEISDQPAFDSWRAKNTDEYGAAIFEYAEGWAKLMQKEIANGKTVVDCAEDTSHKMGFMGITGFMYGAAVSILSECWKHGEELRKWHNKEYNHEGDGVVNPAILTIEK